MLVVFSSACLAVNVYSATMMQVSKPQDYCPSTPGLCTITVTETVVWTEVWTEAWTESVTVSVTNFVTNTVVSLSTLLTTVTATSMVNRVPEPISIIIGAILGGAATAVISASHANSARRILRRPPGSDHGPRLDDFNVEVRSGIRREDDQT